MARASSALAAGLLGGALLYVARTEPRLLTWAEIVPPDESLVVALLPGAVALAVTAVFLRLHWSAPRWVERHGELVTWYGSGRSCEVTPITDLQRAGRADPVAGVAIRVSTLSVRRRTLFVDEAIAEALFPIVRAAGAPAGLDAHPLVGHGAEGPKPPGEDRGVA